MGRHFTSLILLLWCLASFNQGVEIIDPDESSVSAREDSVVEIVCKSTDGSAMSWKFSGMAVVEDAMTTINVVNMGSYQTSTLRLESVTPDNGGTYECHNPDDFFDKATITLNILADDGSRLVEIDNPTDEEIQVTLGQDLRLRCTGAADANLIWKHNGMRIESSTKDIITSAADVEQQITTSLLTRSSMSEDDAGRYACQDAEEIFNLDSVIVDVVDSQPGRASVAISQPQGTSLIIQPGDTLNLRCEGDATMSSLSWAKDGTLVTSTELWNSYTISAGEDVHSGTKFSMLTLEDAPEEASGVYSCQDSENEDNVDQVTVTVGESGSAPIGLQASFWIAAPLLLVAMFMIVQ